MPRATIEVQGKSGSWGVHWDASKAQIDAMREDGIDVGIIENSCPGWVVDNGLHYFWFFFQDIWNLRNPWRA